ncbi:ferredoxin [Streptomyces venezuelae]|uniref:ferredoxin n=1 Tax=Streptomyces venezuelae TaxID=54571 RepID=UPI00123BA463|nr:ferredoxin [Streptomyces venezuelae]QES09221.1 ferredoxin [Streptomyces venezuelae]
MDVRVDRARCLGAGMCALTAPQVFDQDEEEGLVTLLAARPAREQHAAVRVAAGVCPASAITVTAAAEDTDPAV